MPRAGWISLNDYANSFKVSTSTLRRRIKAGEIEHVFESGRYWLPNKPIEKYLRQRVPVETEVKPQAPENFESETPAPQIQGVSEIEVLELAEKMLNELKAAYKHSLQDKEEQILALKEEVADLRTLVKILESNNQQKVNPERENTVELDTNLDLDLDFEIEPWS